jgi:5-oxoprolinase (ATP-hydrolysing)
MAGGAPGAVGENHVLRANGETQVLAHIGQVEMAAGDVFVINTPGGGGYGPASQR